MRKFGTNVGKPRRKAKHSQTNHAKPEFKTIKHTKNNHKHSQSFLPSKERELRNSIETKLTTCTESISQPKTTCHPLQNHNPQKIAKGLQLITHGKHTGIFRIPMGHQTEVFRNSQHDAFHTIVTNISHPAATHQLQNKVNKPSLSLNIAKHILL